MVYTSITAAVMTRPRIGSMPKAWKMALEATSWAPMAAAQAKGPMPL